MADTNSMKNAKAIIRAYNKGGASAAKATSERLGSSMGGVGGARSFIKKVEGDAKRMSKGYSKPAAKKKSKVAKKKVAAKKTTKKVAKKTAKKKTSGRKRAA